MTTNNRLLVYNASAGSGKTFQIATHYLSHLLQQTNPFYINRLIGITFTNKAAEEMKKRIIQNLISAAKGDIKDVMAVVSHNLKETIMSQMALSSDEAYRQEIIKRSRNRLTEILHYYDDFQLTTIDKLMYKIIKTFAREMHLSSDVEVIMDYKEVVSHLIDDMINRIQPGTDLSKFMIALASEKVDNDKSWNIKRDLLAISQIIFDDNYFHELKSLENKQLSDFIALKKMLVSEINKIRGQFVTFGRQMAAIVEAYEDMVKVKTLIRYLITEHAKIEINATLRKQVISENYIYYTKSKLKDLTPVQKEALQGPVNDTIHALMVEIVDYIDQKFESFLFLKALLAEVNALSIEHELQNDLTRFKEEQGSIFISDFNRLILEQILKDLAIETPYIYMRLGEKYMHYFIDEFQDTSALQWHNLIPLVKEALSKEFAQNQKGDAMLVGDAKQSIYRFRGAKPEQFIALSNPEDHTADGNPFAPLTEKSVFNLAYNWRSKPAVIEFNNLFFSRFAKELEAPYDRVYESVAQKIPEGKETGEGYVQIRFLNRKDNKKGIEKEDYAQAVFETILQVQQYGYKNNDICILINRHIEGIKIAEYLNENGIEVISSETLLVAKAAKVIFLLSWLKFLDSGATIDLYPAVQFLIERDDLNKAEVYEELLGNSSLNTAERLKLFENIGYKIDAKLLNNLTIYDTVVYLIAVFNLDKDSSEQAYLQAFLEKIYQMNARETLTLRVFLSEWDIIAEKYSIAAPEKDNAVHIMTVHRSKGLEFPVVIYYTDEAVLSSKDKETKVWVPLNPDKYKGFSLLPVKMGILENSTNETYRQIYQKTAAEKTFDNLNRVYVALTRAVDQLYVMTYAPPQKSTNKGVNQLFKSFLQEQFGFDNNQIFRYGQAQNLSLKKDRDKDVPYLKRLYYQPWPMRQDEFIKINTRTYERWATHKKQAVQYGLQVHNLLSQVTTYTDWQKKQSKYLQNIPAEDIQPVSSMIHTILHHPKLKEYFTDAYDLLNERSILIPDSKAFVQKRPDRLMLKNGVVSILDYKTGEKLAKHRQQLTDYATLLEEAGYEIGQKILVYINKDIDVEII